MSAPDSRATLLSLAEQAPPEYQTMLAAVLHTLPSGQLDAVLRDLHAVGQQINSGDGEAAQQYVANRYGAPGVLMLRSFLQRLQQATPPAQQHNGQEPHVTDYRPIVRLPVMVPNGNPGDTNTPDAIIRKARYGY